MSSPIDLPCNPAFIALEKQPRFETHFFARNNVDYVDEAIAIVENKANTETVRNLFSQTKDARFEADLEAHYQTDIWALSVSPSRLVYYTVIRNQVLPYLSLFAVQEQDIRFQYAWSYSDKVYLGVQARGIYRRLILTDGYITEAAAEGGADNLLRVQHQSMIYAEPSLIWTDPSMRGQPQVGIMITKTGWVSKKIDGVNTDAEGEIGASVRPFANLPELQIGPHFSFTSEAETWGDHARLGIQFQPNDTHGFAISFSSYEWNIGYVLNFAGAQAGIIYESQRVENLIGERDKVETWSAQMGLRF